MHLKQQIGSTERALIVIYPLSILIRLSITAALFALLYAVGSAQPISITKCESGPRITCVVDGDTIWLNGENLRIKGYDTPEPYSNLCGGQREKAIAKRATNRLIELLNGASWTVERFGKGGYGRTLATIRIDGEDVGDILIREGLARRYPDGEKWWCQTD